MIDKEKISSSIDVLIRSDYIGKIGLTKSNIIGYMSALEDMKNSIDNGCYDLKEKEPEKNNETIKGTYCKDYKEEISFLFENKKEIDKLKEEISKLKIDLNSSVEIINTNFGNIFKHLAPPKLEIPGFIDD